MVARRGFVAFAVTAALSAPMGADAATPACRPDPAWGEPAPDKTAELFVLVNAHRSSMGLPTLLSSPTLTDSAAWKSMHMAAYEYVTHEDPPPIARTWQERLRDCGYPDLGAENIAAGSGSALVTFQEWLGSPAHRANIENPTLRATGIGVARSAAGIYYWTQNFGSEVDDGSSPSPYPSSSDVPGSEDGASGAISPGDESANRDPDARADSRRARRTRWIKVRVLGNDSDPDGDSLRIARITMRPSKGRARINDARTFIRYRARRGAGGRDRLIYSVSDGRGGSATALVHIRVAR